VYVCIYVLFYVYAGLFSVVGTVSPAPAAGEWVHVVATYHESKVQIFVNGQRITEQRVCGPGRYSEKCLYRCIYIYATHLLTLLTLLTHLLTLLTL
jgi:hypothetical protein